MVLGAWSREDRLYASNYSVISQGDLAQPLREAIQRLSEGVFSCEAAGVRGEEALGAAVHGGSVRRRHYAISGL